VAAAIVVYLAATCGAGDPVSACPQPVDGSAGEAALQRVRDEAGFEVLYPCSLPGGTQLYDGSITGEPGRQQVELFFEGVFEIAVRQSQFPPAVAPDPTGATRRTIDLFPNVPAALIEINDASGDASYHYYWERDGIFYEVQAVGPPLQERALRAVATSLQ
jgi:hypothetical protein